MPAIAPTLIGSVDELLLAEEDKPASADGEKVGKLIEVWVIWILVGFIEGLMEGLWVGDGTTVGWFEGVALYEIKYNVI